MKNPVTLLTMLFIVVLGGTGLYFLIRSAEREYADTFTANMIVAQRLVRKICQNCIRSFKMPSHTLEQLRSQIAIDEIWEVLRKSEIVAPGQKIEDTTFWRGSGCSQCNNEGYKGRVGIYEIMEISPTLSQLINKKANADELKEAAGLLREADYLPLRFDGFTEGDQLSRGGVDVVVTDGFSGNIALKTAEGTARFVTDLLRRAFKSSLRSKAGFALSRPALNLLRVHLDPNNHNGAVFLGLNGLVVKSHGGATPKGVANAIGVAASMVRNDITRKIGDDLDNFRAHAFANEAAQ